MTTSLIKGLILSQALKQKNPLLWILLLLALNCHYQNTGCCLYIWNTGCLYIWNRVIMCYKIHDNKEILYLNFKQRSHTHINKRKIIEDIKVLMWKF